MSEMREKYESLNLSELKEVAKFRGLRGVSALKKADLINAMLKLDEEEEQRREEERRVKQEAADFNNAAGSAEAAAPDNAAMGMKAAATDKAATAM
ncbi:MAG: Rho termination factor N-terminal domain-containing protein [Lachnospiraceae bacterium]|nr:Rho termination factor N-terminal domain-containing protein [Lachnospiraceae bacterium]